MTAALSAIKPKALSIPPVWIRTSLLVSVLITVTSLCGIVLEKTYSRETTAWAIQAVPLLVIAATMGLGIIAMFSIPALKRTVVLITGRDHGWNNYHNFNGLFLPFPESNKRGLKKNLHISRKLSACRNSLFLCHCMDLEGFFLVYFCYLSADLWIM